MSELYIVFNVAEAEYAIAASLVLQLESYAGATPVPGTSPHVIGIMQARGQVIPVIDLRRLFGHQSVPPSPDTRVIVTQRGERRVGLLVDKSREVLRIESNSIQATPALVDDNSHGFFGGLVQLQARLLMLLDLGKVVGEEDLNDEFSKRLESGHGEAAKLGRPVSELVARDDGDPHSDH